MSLNFNEHLTLSEELIERPIKTRIVCTSHHTGEVEVMENSVIYPGRRFLIEAAFKRNASTDQMATLNRELGIANNVVLTPEIMLGRAVCLFGVGIGGAGDLFGDINAVRGTNNALNNIIPLRTVESGMSLGVDADKYYMRKTFSDVNTGKSYQQYYLKEIIAEPIKTMSGSTPYLPKVTANDHTHPDSQEVVSIYSASRIEIDVGDIKEHFRLMDSNINRARFNELALYFGTKINIGDAYEYVAVEAFSRLSFNNKGMDSESSRYTFNYYVYS